MIMEIVIFIKYAGLVLRCHIQRTCIAFRRQDWHIVARLRQTLPRSSCKHHRRSSLIESLWEYPYPSLRLRRSNNRIDLSLRLQARGWGETAPGQDILKAAYDIINCSDPQVRQVWKKTEAWSMFPAVYIWTSVGDSLFVRSFSRKWGSPRARR